MCRAAAGVGLARDVGLRPADRVKGPARQQRIDGEARKGLGLVGEDGHGHLALAQRVEQLGDACVGLGFGLPAPAVLGFHRGLGASDGSVVAGRGRQGAAHQVFQCRCR